MKKILFLLCLIAMSINAAEQESRQTSEPPAAAAAISDATPTSEDDDDWQVVSEPRPDIPPATFEKLSKLLQAVNEASIDSVPMEVFEIEPEFWKGIKVSGGFWLKSTAISLANLYSYIAPFSLSYILRSVSSPALYSYASLVTKGDSENFPPLPLNYVAHLFKQESIVDRKSFAKVVVPKRSYSFETEGFNGLGKGYKGRLILVDFAYGTRIVEGGGEYRVISQYADRNPLDCLVALKEFKSPIDWINARFVIPGPLEFAKIGQTFKNKGGHTCILYEAAAPPDCLMILAVRIPEQEYLDMEKLCKEVWRRNQEAAGICSVNADAAKK